ncbi:alpha/beta hydrolase [Variovorax rhizosphaerae]|uniref:Alpha/beta hydrolase n=1 Tax=Variovorax rhizosphaerae TaxID=1836200 RepID=A0ABU8WL47_9BURK
MPNIAKTLATAAACIAVLFGCQTVPTPRTMHVNGFELPYVVEGQGIPVVFIHGGVSDYRTWDRQRAALAARGYQAISYTQRYFGPEPWVQSWPAFGIQTHADDLVSFLRGLSVGPVHLVAWSYGGQTALAVALDHPELVKSAFVFEPSHPTFVTDPAQLKALSDDGAAYAGPVVQAVRSGDNALAVKRLIDGVGERPSYFDAQSAATQAVQLDSAHSMAVIFDEKNVRQISCEQLAKIKRPVAIARGGQVRPYFRIIADEAARCLQRGGPIVVPGQKHMWPSEDAAGFAATVDEFLARK